MSWLVRGLIGLVVLVWAGGMIWYGKGLLSWDGDGHAQMGGFSMVATGMLLLVPTFAGIIYNVMKVRAPAKRSERPTEPEELVFDADAAIQRYLAAKKDAPAAEPAPMRPVSERPVFGRRGA